MTDDEEIQNTKNVQLRFGCNWQEIIIFLSYFFHLEKRTVETLSNLFWKMNKWIKRL